MPVGASSIYGIRGICGKAARLSEKLPYGIPIGKTGPHLRFRPELFRISERLSDSRISAGKMSKTLDKPKIVPGRQSAARQKD